jgi:hypothetical protein
VLLTERLLEILVDVLRADVTPPIVPVAVGKQLLALATVAAELPENGQDLPIGDFEPVANARLPHEVETGDAPAHSHVFLAERGQAERAVRGVRL